MAWKFLATLIFLILGQILDEVMPCSMSDDVCEFWMEIRYRLTMMDYKTAVYPTSGKLYHYNVKNITTAEPVDVNRVVSADGWERSRLVMTVNGTLPGPPIEVYEGQTVVIHLKNLLNSVAVTMHWHGLHQYGTPWMDGVGFITQYATNSPSAERRQGETPETAAHTIAVWACPILPGQSFTYKFKAHPKGTFWYHSHVGSQMSMGLVGAFIIRERMPPLMEEFIMMIQEWNHNDDGDMVYEKMGHGFYEDRKKVLPTGSLDGSHFSIFPIHAGLINGRGRFYFPDGKHNGAPLTVYRVKRMKSYRFRVIGSTSLYPFRVSVDGHNLTLLASDGYDLQPIVVESFVINTGERFDFEIQTDQPVGNYWIRAETLETEHHIAEAILRYEGAPEVEPTTHRKQCSPHDRCLVVNCPFLYYPVEAYTDCKDVGQLKATDVFPVPGTLEGQAEDIEDVFLNFAFPGEKILLGSTNGRVFRLPSVSALTQPKEINTLCDDLDCGEDKICKCSFTINLEHNKVYQVIFLNMGKGKGWAHPIHMHGHSFYVVKMGFPTYNTTTGKYIDDSPDINCRGNPDKNKSYCNNATWTNTSWGGNNIPGLTLELPLRKDTIMIPSGGYAAVRIRADNPGLWIVHCHIELHQTDGMSMLLNESFPHQSAPPHGFPRCGDFSYKETANSEQKEESGYSKGVFWSVVGILLTLLLVLTGLLLWPLRDQLVSSKNNLIDATTTYRDSKTNAAFEGK